MISSTGPSDAVDPLPQPRRTRTLLLLLILIGLFFVWWKQGMPIPLPQRVTAPRYLGPRFPHFPTEQEWLVGQITRQIAETAGYAKAGKGPGVLRLHVKTTRQWPTKDRPEHYQFEMKLGGTDFPAMELDLNNYLWDPANFTALARQLLGSPDNALAVHRSAADLEMFQRLLQPMPDILIREDKRLSEALTFHPLDAELHEEAALLVGSFALRHVAASFYDVRTELSAITSHLAVARALDKKTGPSGELAEAILCTLSGRQSAALAILEGLARNSGTVAGLPLEASTTWNRALTMRITGDYRKLDQPEHATLLERLEYVRALQSSVSSETASSFLVNFPAERLAEWSNIMLSGGFSVTEGHMWTERALGSELEETATAYRAYHGKQPEESEIAQALNAPTTPVAEADGGIGQLEVLGWGRWAQLHQRQLCQIFNSTWYWLEEQWGVPDQAAKFKEAITKDFSELERFPLVGMETDKDPTDIAENDLRRAKLWQEKPELVPFESWNQRPSPMTRAMAKVTGALSPYQWFSPTFPLGTLYDAGHRIESAVPVMEQGQLDQLKETGPYNKRVLYHHIMRTWRYSPTPDQMAAQFEPVTGYDTWSMEVVANALQKDPDLFEAAYTPICRVNPNQYLNLARYLREHHREEAAVRAYEKAIQLARDRVWVSNSMEWLVDYYYTHNRQTEAFAVAEKAADAYSAAGLKTMAHLCERADRLFDAETYFRRVAERYEQWQVLALFYSRHRTHPKFADEYRRIAVKVFPKGEEAADPVSMHGAPADGVLLTTTSKITDSLGLRIGDVIVAINGTRVRNQGQYFYKMDAAASPKVDLIVWAARAYRAVSVDLPDHRLGAVISDFRPQTSP